VTEAFDLRITPVVMVGGSGTRLWPLSRRNRPKQFHALVGDQSLLLTTVDRVIGRVGATRFLPPIVVTGETHADIVRDQLTGIALGRLVLEPVGRSTAPCAVVAAELARASDPDALILLLPSDHFIADAEGFRRAVAHAAPSAVAGELVTFGVKPTRPETGYGYILAEGEAAVRPVIRFVEKPDAGDRGDLRGGRALLLERGDFPHARGSAARGNGAVPPRHPGRRTRGARAGGRGGGRAEAGPRGS
jgi:mannose-1-phosphate guanylyltransferase/mannose-1-phosphate guanylyltransferase/mannose-6-phosphate isomerase